MSTEVISVRPDTPIKDAVQLLDQHRITMLPVTDDRGELVGVVSEADVLVDAFMPDQRAHERPITLGTGPTFTSVGQVMTRQVLTVPAGADLAQAADLMLATVAKSLPVIEANRVVGMLSRADLIGILAERDEAIEAGVDDLIRTAGYDWMAEVTEGVVSVTGPRSESDLAIAEALVSTVPGVVGVRFS
ncbi:CBS domain-containing protein [Methylocystis sp.]|uniref:CBS domain-containing protein n=1 Tax=Methylocystis sp. TaxID=1911079 RepID=UPI003DA490A2